MSDNKNHLVISKPKAIIKTVHAGQELGYDATKTANVLPPISELTQSIIDAGQERHAIDNAQWPIGQPVVFAADGSSPTREGQLGYVVGYPREGNKLFVYVPAMHDNRTAEPVHLCAIDENGIPKEQGAGIISPEAFAAQQAAAAANPESDEESCDL